ncbi:hypothetical protein QVD17_10468 [Tagetes erecta]|uniref:Uncharacterized protein n=1 Tax=Tagetes erecta TaxID=13708 RepID=A0AAD8L803_TARER|nr:hypothetical protein QVD17_10468 [Tagetes erecta]
MTPEECFDPEALMLELGDSDQLLDDFLEINDLANPLSRTTSSADSSCMTMTSEDFFDSDALMRELGDDNADQETQDSRVNLNLSAPATLKQVVMQQATLGSVDNVAESEPSAGQTSEKNPTPEIEHISNEVDKSAPPSSSSSSPPPPTSSPPLLPPPSSSLPSSNGSEGSSKEEKKECANRTKKRRLMKYLCFLAF